MISNIIDTKNNDKAKSSRGYEHWTTKHNMTTATDIIAIHEKVFESMRELEKAID